MTVIDDNNRPRFLPGYDDKKSAYFVPEELRDYYAASDEDLIPPGEQMPYQADSVAVGIAKEYAAKNFRTASPHLGQQQQEYHAFIENYARKVTRDQRREYLHRTSWLPLARRQHEQAQALAAMAAEKRARSTCEVCKTVGEHVLDFVFIHADGTWRKWASPQGMTSKPSDPFVAQARACNGCVAALSAEAVRRSATQRVDNRTRAELATQYFDRA